MNLSDSGGDRGTAAPPGGGEPVIEAHGLRMRYGTKEVLRGIDLTVYRGEVVTLLGPNGAGKSTTLEILEGFRERSAGEVRVLGTDPGRGDETWRAGVGVVLQSWRDHGRWRVRELLDLTGSHYTPYSTPGRSRPYPADELLALVGLESSADSVVATLSGGQRRRLDLAMGIVGRPELLFLDEPTTGLDPQARQEFHELVRRLAEREGTTFLLTTHDLAEAERLADRILILVDGGIAARGTPAELAERAAGRAEVRYTRDGESRVTSVTDATGYVRALFTRYGDAIGDLEVRRADLEDVYLAMVRSAESGGRAALAEVTA
ncbi:ABC transporter ATP-binding protein [Streptomyces sp. CAU 1734]|uniref:ABC transporter ATP-binding protein n=1 Tax=Streptomyces sp. CAU 1734 TaxID=3140360 RepID=UPI00326049A2